MRQTTYFTVILILLSNLLSAQIPNSSFENWSNLGVPTYEDPDNWGTVNGSTNIIGILTVKKASGADAYSGSYAVILETFYISFANRTAPGVTATGTFNTQTEELDGGVPYTGRPDAMLGWFKYAPATGDNCELNINLYKWNNNTNQRDLIGEGEFTTLQTVSSYTQFIAPITYLSGSNPDTMVIILSSSNTNTPVAGSKLFIDSLSLFTAPPFVVTATKTNPYCNGNCDGNVSLIVSGGMAPYSYTWSGLGQNANNTNIADSLCAGILSVTVTDVLGSQYDSTFSLVNRNFLLPPTTTSTPENCGQSDGTISVVPQSAGTYVFRWSDPNNQTDSTATNLSAGTYTVTITDPNGCYSTASGSVASSGGLSASITQQTNVACVGDTTGDAIITATGGQTPYTYLWDANAGSQTTMQATGLSAGSYSATASDANGCTFVVGVAITEASSALTIDNIAVNEIMCYGGTASATATITGGLFAYTYAWSSSSDTTDTETGLTAGTYTFSVTDGAGCEISTPFTVDPEPTPLTVTTSAIDESVQGANDGVLIGDISGGTPPYTYAWYTVQGALVNDTAAVAPGTYKLDGVDDNACREIVNTFVAPGPVGINEANNNTMSLFPNPATSELLLTIKENADEVMIYNTIGKLIKTVSVDIGANVISLNNFNSGMYIMELKRGNSTIAKSNFVVDK